MITNSNGTNLSGAGYAAPANRGPTSEMCKSSVDMNALQKSSTTKPTIAKASKPLQENCFKSSTPSFISKIEFASVSGVNRKRKKPVP